MRRLFVLLVLPSALAALAGAPLRAEVIERVVAKVNGQIITLSDFQSRQIAAAQTARVEPANVGTFLRQNNAKILQDAIDEVLIMQRAEEAGIKAPPAVGRRGDRRHQEGQQPQQRGAVRAGPAARGAYPRRAAPEHRARNPEALRARARHPGQGRGDRLGAARGVREAEGDASSPSRRPSACRRSWSRRPTAGLSGLARSGPRRRPARTSRRSRRRTRRPRRRQTAATSGRSPAPT